MNLTNQYCYFFDEAEFKETDRPGFRRRVVTGDNLQLWFWRIKGGSRGSYMHQHAENEQLGVIMRGQLDFRIGDKESDMLAAQRGGIRHRILIASEAGSTVASVVVANHLQCVEVVSKVVTEKQG
jgi:hypothetical protein